MILFTALAAVGAAVIISSLIDMFYDDIIKWLKTIGQVAKRVVQGALIGCKTFINVGRATLRTAGKEISKNYSKVGEQWQVTEVSRDVPSDKIPDEIYQQSMQVNSDMLELTQDIEAQLLKNYQ
ncbi:MAG: hypothetical protein NC177_13450 [Ruminococcus flavefaciens]|nr:hypothetical protein [Ruminococcus flavefaciens]